MTKLKKDWLLALLLTLPMLVFYAGHYLNHTSSIIPTGFIAYDNVSYIAYAKEYLDQDKFSLFYSNPLNDSGNYPRIYFQTQNLFFIPLLSLGMPPGLVLVIINCLFTLLSFRIIIAIYDHLFPNSSNRKLFITFFCWGGGLLALSAIPLAIKFLFVYLDFLERLFYIDPGWGWWGMNLGRGLFISSEGYYHFLFLAAILCILKRKWIATIALAFILCLSHPFTGIEFLAIVTGWAALEKIVIRNRTIPWYFLAGMSLIMAFHLYYYLYYLNQFPEHRAVSEQYSLNWRLRFFNMIPAWCIVGGLAIWSVVKLEKDFFKDMNRRLFLSWFVIALLLANHELFMKPMQPIHFTRGYIWTSLFLLGLPALHDLFLRARQKKFKILIAILSAVILSDNFLWILNNVRFTAYTESISHISPEQKGLLQVIRKNASNQTLIIGKDETMPYLSTVYTSAHPWISHPFTTPFATKKEQAYKKFIEENIIDSAWKKREVILIFRKNLPEELERSRTLNFPVEKLADTKKYILLKARIPE